MTNKLHIVAFDIPFPADYGGLFDLFNKLKYLNRKGVIITLHCFEYGRKRQPELEKYCAAVYYYPRRKNISLRLPYIVSSRRNELLRQRLLESEGTILLEGIHCTYYLHNGDLKNRNVWVRLHNVEYEYYYRLFKTSRHPFKKLYYFFESFLLNKYEKKLAAGNKFLAVSLPDAQTYHENGAKEVDVLPPFLGSYEVHSLTGKGDYCLYHGNLSVDENEAAVFFLVEEIFAGLQIPLIISGKDRKSG